MHVSLSGDLARRAGVSAVAVMVSVFSTLILSTATPAWAAKILAGSVSCQASGSLSTTPGISSAGTPGKKLVVNVTTKLTNCHKSGDPSFPSAPASVSVNAIKLSGEAVGGSKKNEVVGKAADLAKQMDASHTSVKVDWGPGIKTSKEKNVVPNLKLPPDPCVGGGAACEASLQLQSATNSGGQFGVTDFFDAASTQTLQDLVNGSVGPGGSASTLTFDTTTSSATEGPAVLTTGGPAGSNVGVGDVVSVTGFALSGLCVSGSGQGIVLSNPTAPGSAEISLTSLTITNCHFPGNLIRGISVVPNNLPYMVSLADGSGDPAALSDLNVTPSDPALGVAGCPGYDETNIVGSFSNSTNDFTGAVDLPRPFPGGNCSNWPTTLTGTLKIGAIVDQSVSGSPSIFVN